MEDTIRKFQYHGDETLVLPAERAAFATLQEWIAEVAAELNLAKKTANMLYIAADEIFTNIASYAYPNGNGCAKIRMEYDSGTGMLRMIFADSGVAYNPLESPQPDISKPLAEREIGGLGVFMVKQMMSSMEYRRTNNENIMILEKNIRSDA